MIDQNAITIQMSWHRYAPTIQFKELAKLGANALGIGTGQTKGLASLILERYTRPLQECESAGRRVLQRNTLQVGPHCVLPTANFIHFQEELSAHLNEWDVLRREFLDKYDGEILPESKDQFRAASGRLVLPEEKWLPAALVADRIRIERHQFPFGNAGNVPNLRHLDDQSKEAMEAEVRESIARATDEAQSQLRRRLRDELSKFVEKMKSYRGAGTGDKLYDSITGNIRSVIELIPRLLVTEDNELLDLCAQATKIAAWDVDILKESHVARSDARQDAEQILAAMAL